MAVDNKMANSTVTKSFMIGDHIYHPHLRELVKGAAIIRLEERTAQALDLLCEKSDLVVSREELIQEIWNGRAVSDNSVAVVISDLRKALNDDARAPKIIQTVPKRGYRALNVSLRQENGALNGALNGASPAAVSTDSREVGLKYLSLAACIACSVALIIYFTI